MRLSILIVFIVAFYGCTNVYTVSNEAKKSEEQSGCRSAVEAFLQSDTVFIAKPPFLVLKRTHGFDERKSFHGGIVSISDTGIIFVKAKDGLYTPEPAFYPFENIACLVDSNNKIIYGQLKKNTPIFWSIDLVCNKIDTIETKPITLVLQANKGMSYCVDPGEYRIVYFKFRTSEDYYDQYLDQSDSLSSARFLVARDSITYIGTFHLEYKWTPSHDMAIIPITVLNRPKISSIYTNPIVGGGLLGYLAAVEIKEREKKESPHHALKITIDSSYVPLFKSNLPIKYCPITIK
jgi:hypothetical protein